MDHQSSCAWAHFWMKSWLAVTPHLALQQNTRNCNKLQHKHKTCFSESELLCTTKHINTLQHIATHYNTLQRTTTHCNPHARLNSLSLSLTSLALVYNSTLKYSIHTRGAYYMTVSVLLDFIATKDGVDWLSAARMLGPAPIRFVQTQS